MAQTHKKTRIKSIKAKKTSDGASLLDANYRLISTLYKAMEPTQKAARKAGSFVILDLMHQVQCMVDACEMRMIETEQRQ